MTEWGLAYEAPRLERSKSSWVMWVTNSTLFSKKRLQANICRFELLQKKWVLIVSMVCSSSSMGEDLAKAFLCDARRLNSLFCLRTAHYI